MTASAIDEEASAAPLTPSRVSSQRFQVLACRFRYRKCRPPPTRAGSRTVSDIGNAGPAVSGPTPRRLPRGSRQRYRALLRAVQPGRGPCTSRGFGRAHWCPAPRFLHPARGQSNVVVLPGLAANGQQPMAPTGVAGRRSGACDVGAFRQAPRSRLPDGEPVSQQRMCQTGVSNRADTVAFLWF